MQQVVAHGHAGTNCHINVLVQVGQQGFHSIDGGELFVERHQLPIVLADGTFHLLLGQLQLEFANLLTHTCQAVSVDYLSTSKDGLHGGDGCNDTTLHHCHIHRGGQGCHCFRWERLGKRGTQLRRDHRLWVECHLCHSSVGIECGSSSTHVREVLREGLSPLLVCCLNVVVSRTRGEVILERRVGELAEGKRLSSLPLPVREGSRYLCR